MTPFKTFAAGLSAALLASSMLAGTSFAAPKPQMNLNIKANVPKPMIMKPMRPHIVRRPVQIQIDRKRLQKKTDDNGAQAILPDAAPRKAAAAATLLPPKRFPQPRPDIDDALADIKDAIGADGVAGIDPDELRVAVNPPASDGPLGDFGLPGDADKDQQAGDGSPGPFGGMPGDDSMWNDPRGGIGTGIPNPAGDSSHGKGGPAVPGFLSAKTASVADINPAGEKEPKVTDTGWQLFSDRGGPFRTRSVTTDYPDGSSISEVYLEDENGLSQEITVTDAGGAYDTTTTQYDQDGNQVGEPTYRSGTIIAELRNPDYVGGGGYVPVNCGTPACNEARKGKLGPQLSDGMVRALTDPEHSTAAPRNGADPIVSQHDLLSQQDPDFNGGGGPTPIDKPRIQSD